MYILEQKKTAALFILSFCLSNSYANEIHTTQQKIIDEQEIKLVSDENQATALSHSLSDVLRVKVVKPQDDTVIRQAQAPEHIIGVPYNKVILGKDGNHLSITGQLSSVGFMANDSLYNRSYITTNDTEDHRLTFQSLYQYTPMLAVGTRIQFGFNANLSSSVTQFQTAETNIDMRILDLEFTHDKYGKIYFGHGHTSTDDTAYVDLSGTKIAGRSSVYDIGAGLYFNGSMDAPQVKNYFNALDGMGRLSRLRYDSPSFKGFIISSSIIENNQDDIALKYGQEFNDTKVAFALSYTSPLSRSVSNNAEIRGHQSNASASILFTSGLNFSFAVGKLESNLTSHNSPKYYYLKPGLKRQLISMGLTALSFDYGQYANFYQSGGTGIAKGIQLVQNIDEVKTTVYFNFRQFSVKGSDAMLNNINLVSAGALYKF